MIVAGSLVAFAASLYTLKRATDRGYSIAALIVSGLEMALVLLGVGMTIIDAFRDS